MRVTEIQTVSSYKNNSRVLSTLSPQNNQTAAQNLGLPSSALLKSYYLKPRSKVSFRGAPWRIFPNHYGVSNFGSITANDAIKIYEKFKLGNFLDIGDDRQFYHQNNSIRKENLEFLDRVTNSAEKIKFIDYYKNLTGFPDLKQVSENIKSAFTSAVQKASSSLNTADLTNRFNIVQAGYDGVCSVGKCKALPGSDLDKAYVIIKGSGDKYNDIEDVNQFKGKLWENTDQRILSYNHDEAAFPQVYTENQVEKLLSAINTKAESLGLHEKSLVVAHPQRAVFGIIGIISSFKLDTNFNKYKSLLNAEYKDNYVAANPFYIELCKKFPKSYSDALNIDGPSRENVKNFGFFLEALREGKSFGNFPKLDYTKRIFADSDAFQLTNLSQLSALKNRGDKKPKRLARENLATEFDNWTTDKQFRFIKTLIESSCANNTNFTTEFPEYFSRKGSDPFEPLISAMMK